MSGTLLARMGDGLTNLVSRLGSRADRNTQSFYTVPYQGQPQLEAAYRSSWLTRKVTDLPPFEMTRAGRVWNAEPDQIEALEATEMALQLWAKIRKALSVARLHGGSAIIFGVRQGSPDQPLRVENLGKNSLRYAIVVSKHQLSAPYGQDLDPESDFYMQPAMWELQTKNGGRVKIHPSRVFTFHGAPLPEGATTISWLDQFWGDPILYALKAAIDNAETSQAAVATLLHELKQDIIWIPGLTEQIATQEAEERLARRLSAVTTFKGMFGTLFLDGGDPDAAGDSPVGKEEWETRQLSFAQMPETLRQFIAIVAGAADIPVTRLMGESPGGLQSTGKGEQDDFNKGISSKQIAELKPTLVRMDEILLRSVLGQRPPEISWTFAPLEEMSEAQRSEIDKRDAETVDIYVRTNLIPMDALAKVTANRMTESGRWPGLDQAIDESDQEPGEAKLAATELAQQAANENTVAGMEERGAVSRDQALALLTDARPRTLYVQRKLLNAAEFIAWARGQGFETTTPADDLHVTIAFSRQPVDWMKVGETWNNDKAGKLTVAPGGARIVEPLGDKGAVVLLFSSSELSWRHEEIKRAGASFDFSEYQPHVTITYAAPEGLDLSKVEPFRGKLEFGPEIFEEVTEDWQNTIAEV